MESWVAIPFASVGVMEIVRRTPRRLFLLAAVLVLMLVLVVLAYAVWAVAFLAAVVTWKVGRGAVRGWREAA